jgi:hypothetical protein
VASVYLETSFFSLCATNRSGEIDLGRRATSREWWRKQRDAFQLFVSEEVVRELSSPDFPAEVRTPALAMLRGLFMLDLTPEVTAMSELLVRERVMPGPAVAGDALHMAVSAVHGMDYVLTWNQKHLANPNKRVHLSVICARIGLNAPQIVTPDMLIVETDYE